MSEDLRRQLQSLEDDYFGQPVVVQQADLREINQLRARLGMPLVDAHLKAVGPPSENHLPQTQPEEAPAAAPDHTEAREIYLAYLKKAQELAAYRAYAEQVARATAGHGMTPVLPLATMGSGGGPLLCDHCGKPIVLEGGSFHGVAADVAWQKNPSANSSWVSWILGGMVVEIQTNGTLRIYHGYPGANDSHCCNAAARQHEKARAEFRMTKVSQKREKILAYLEHELADKTPEERHELLNEIMDTMYRYDPGLGINRPSAK